MQASTLLLRGANDYMLDEMDRALHDALCVIKRVLESGFVVPGGGAVEVCVRVRACVHSPGWYSTMASTDVRLDGVRMGGQGDRHSSLSLIQGLRHVAPSCLPPRTPSFFKACLTPWY